MKGRRVNAFSPSSLPESPQYTSNLTSWALQIHQQIPRACHASLYWVYTTSTHPLTPGLRSQRLHKALTHGSKEFTRANICNCCLSPGNNKVRNITVWFLDSIQYHWINSPQCEVNAGFFVRTKLKCIFCDKLEIKKRKHLTDSLIHLYFIKKLHLRIWNLESNIKLNNKTKKAIHPNTWVTGSSLCRWGEWMYSALFHYPELRSKTSNLDG